MVNDDGTGYVPTSVYYFIDESGSKIAYHSGSYDALEMGDPPKTPWEHSKTPHPTLGAIQTGAICTKKTRTIYVDGDHLDKAPADVRAWLDLTATAEEIVTSEDLRHGLIPRKRTRVIVPDSLIDLWPGQNGTGWGDIKSKGFTAGDESWNAKRRYGATGRPPVVADRALMHWLASLTGLDSERKGLAAHYKTSFEDVTDGWGSYALDGADKTVIPEEFGTSGHTNSELFSVMLSLLRYVEDNGTEQAMSLYDEIVKRYVSASHADYSEEDCSRALINAHDNYKDRDTRAAEYAQEQQDWIQSLVMRTWEGTWEEFVADRTSRAQANYERYQTVQSGDIWEAHPVLSSIRQAAYARRTSPMAVLLCVMARVSAFRPYGLDAHSYGPLSLNWYSAIIGNSSSGKTKAMRCAEDLLPVPRNLAIEEDGHKKFVARGIGSGEGIIDLYRGMISVQGTNEDGTPKSGRPAKVPSIVRHNAMLVTDEGSAFIESSTNRRGSTALGIFNEAWSGGSLSMANALGNEREIDRAQYALGAIVGFQPVLMAQLLGTGEYGTSQRFCYATPQDAGIPRVRPEFPAPLNVSYPDGAYSQDGDFTRCMTFAASIIEEVDRHDWEASQPGYVADEQNGKHYELRLRCAALLHLLFRFDGTEVGTGVWDLAEVIISRSEAVRDETAKSYGDRAEQAVNEFTRKAEERIRELDEEGLSAGAIRMKLSRKQREQFTVEDIKGVIEAREFEEDEEAA